MPVELRVLEADESEESDSGDEGEVEKGEDVSLEETKERTEKSTVDLEKDPSQSGFTILGGFEKKTVPKVLILRPC